MKSMSNTNNIEIDERKFRKMRFHIYSLERKNYLTGEYTHAEMRREIRKIIIDEYKKNIGG